MKSVLATSLATSLATIVLLMVRPMLCSASNDINDAYVCKSRIPRPPYVTYDACAKTPLVDHSTVLFSHAEDTCPLKLEIITNATDLSPHAAAFDERSEDAVVDGPPGVSKQENDSTTALLAVLFELGILGLGASCLSVRRNLKDTWLEESDADWVEGCKKDDAAWEHASVDTESIGSEQQSESQSESESEQEHDEDAPSSDNDDDGSNRDPQDALKPNLTPLTMLYSDTEAT